MKEIKLSKGLFALVDDEDYDYLNQFKWCASKNGKTHYAIRRSNIKGKVVYLRMHRLIMHTPEGIEVDHMDRNGLNCQKYNMRNCTHKQNLCNQRPHGASKYIGVSISKGKIRASIKIKNKHKHIGYFKTEEEAAIARDIFAKEHFGEFANFNFKL